MTDTTIVWPPKHDLFGVRVSATTCDAACDAIIAAAQKRVPAIVSAFAVHALVEASCSTDLKNKANRFAIITPDGQSIYLYGSSPQTLAALETNLLKHYPALKIAGVESPPFRQLSSEEDAAMVERVNSSGAGLMFLGLGCPKQDYFAAAHADTIQAVQLCVGAAFDFHAGTKATAPAWMQRRGLEWVFRLVQEPKRLWKRYLVTNTIFLRKLGSQMMSQYVFGHQPGTESN